MDNPPILGMFMTTEARSGRRLYLNFLFTVGLLAPLTLFAIYAIQEERVALDGAEDRLMRRAVVLAEHAARALDAQAVTLDAVEQDLNALTPEQIRSSDRIPILLAEYASRIPVANGLMVLDSNGVALASSRGPRDRGNRRADREYMTESLASPGKLIVGPQITGRASGQKLFTLSRAVANGTVLVASIYVRYFEEVLKTLAEQESGSSVATLYREDGRQLVRYPVVDVPVNLSRDDPGLMHYIPDQRGTYRIVPVSGRIERLYAFHRVPGYPVYVTIGMDIPDLMAPWRNRMVTNGLLAVAVAALLAGMTLLAIRRAEEGDRIEARLTQLVEERTAEAERRAREAQCAAREREAAQQVAERANQAKSHFLAAASHDLRQPIQGLRLFLEVLSMRLTGAEDTRILAMATRALEGAEELLSTLLSVSALEAGMVRPDPARVCLADIIRPIIEEFSPQFTGKGLDLRWVPSARWVDTDPVLLARIIRNLLTNALRYTDQGRVLVGCRRDATGIRIEICDTGPGIPSDKLDLVFEDFVQLGNAERDRSKGLGLGLAVVRRTAALLGLQVGVRSTVQRGTAFWIHLPAVAVRI